MLLPEASVYADGTARIEIDALDRQPDAQGKYGAVTAEALFELHGTKHELKEFLEEGDKVKVTLRFKGREMAHKELGMEVLKRVEKDLVEDAVVEQFPRLEGRQMVMMMGPKKK